MAHHTVRTGYRQLVDRLNRFPQGAPPSEVLYRILELLFDEREAELVARLPLRPFTARQAARLWRMEEADAEEILQRLAGRAILLDIEWRGRPRYTLPPPMAGFFEFSLMRVRDDLDQKTLAELLYQYLNVEHDFVRELFAVGETALGRAFVHEPVLPADGTLEVLDFERASAVIGDASDIGVGLCYCRHKMQHVGRACDAPMEVCMTLGSTATSLIRNGHARRAEPAEALEMLHQAREQGLVQFGENVREGVNFICHCCGCCCEALLAAQRFCHDTPIQTTNYLPALDADSCRGCGRCVDACPVGALSLVSAQDPHKRRRRRAKLEAEICLGCGVCVPACRDAAIALRARPARVVTPVNSLHRAVLFAIERGSLANLIFDHQALASHRAMAGVLGVILRLPPLKQALASEQMKSRYLDRLLQ